MYQNKCNCRSCSGPGAGRGTHHEVHHEERDGDGERDARGEEQPVNEAAVLLLGHQLATARPGLGRVLAVTLVLAVAVNMDGRYLH